MNKRLIIAIGSAMFIGFVASSSGALAQKTAKACEDEWKANKAEIQKSGKKKKDFIAECRGTAAKPAATTTEKPAAATTTAPAKPAATTTTTPAKPAATTTPSSTATGKSGREAETARIRECGKEWKADKAAGKIEKGMTWPKYWSDCNKRLKAAGQ
jgi:hypothetical protein